MVSPRRFLIWFKMLFGKSELHVKQPVGSFFDKERIGGYYNDFSNKVLFDKKTSREVNFIPMFTTDHSEKVFFPIQIAQYGLGSYELFLKTNDDVFLKKMLSCANFFLKKVDVDGGVKCFFFLKNLKTPYSAMCQGEVLSLLLRAYIETNDKKYIKCAERVYDFMLNKGLENGILTMNEDDHIFLHEYANSAIVLNGFIFALFGLYDFYLINPNTDTKSCFMRAYKGLICILPDFDFNSWSYYDLNYKFASKFYHQLHINLLCSLNELYSNDSIVKYISRWKKSLNNKKMRIRMFWAKAKQKLRG